jgi:flagellar export protein FliJ
MPFHFSLATLLHHRASLERKREIAFTEAIQRVGLVQQEIDNQRKQLRTMEIAASHDLEAGVIAAQLQFEIMLRANLGNRLEQLNQELAKAEELRELARSQLQEARRQRESVDIIRKHQLEEYLRDEKRREQRRMDDLFLLRRRPRTHS